MSKHLKADNVRTVCGISLDALDYKVAEIVEIAEDATCEWCLENRGGKADDEVSNNTSDGTEDPSASYSREALNLWLAIEEILVNRIKFIGKNEQIYTGYPAELIKELTDLCTKRETLARGQENHYWIDKYSREIKALDGFTDKPEKDRLKRLRRTHQDRLSELKRGKT